MKAKIEKLVDDNAKIRVDSWMIRCRRLEWDVTAEDLAWITGLSLQEMWDIMHTSGKVEIKRLKKVAAGLNFPLEWLMR